MKRTEFKIGDIVRRWVAYREEILLLKTQEDVNRINSSTEIPIPLHSLSDYTLMYRPDPSLILTIITLLDGYKKLFPSQGYLRNIFTEERTTFKRRSKYAKAMYEKSFNMAIEHHYDVSDKTLAYCKSLSESRKEGMGMHIVSLLQEIPEVPRQKIMDNRSFYEHFIVTELSKELRDYLTPFEDSKPIVSQAPTKIWKKSPRLERKLAGADLASPLPNGSIGIFRDEDENTFYTPPIGWKRIFIDNPPTQEEMINFFKTIFSKKD